jgi:predicted tellurium resistance membrane protein TerC
VERRSYFLVSGLLDRLVYLSSGLSVVLGFIGVKLALEFLHLHDHRVLEISTGLSLAVLAIVSRSRRSPAWRASGANRGVAPTQGRWRARPEPVE